MCWEIPENVLKMQVYVWIRYRKQPDIFTYKGEKDVLKVNW